MMAHVRRCFVLGALLIGTLGCSGKDEPIPPLWVGPPRQAVPAEFADSYFVLAHASNNPPAWVVVDSGAPFSLLRADVFGGALTGMSEIAALSIGDVTLWRVPAYMQSSVLTESVKIDGYPFGGLLGYSAYSPLRLSFDPQAHSLGIGGVALPDGVDVEGTSQSFSVRGGGVVSSGFSSLSFPKSRIIISAQIEGTPVRLLFDTGASTLSLSPNVFSAMVSDGRPTVDTQVSTVSGTSPATAARASSVTTFDQTTTSTLILSSSALEPLLTQLTSEVGEPIDGLLGHSFLREFFTIIDYPAGRISLHRFSDLSYVLDDFRRVGFSLKQEAGSFQVEMVFPGTAAEAQLVTPGEPVTAIDGVATSDLGPIRSELALRGVVGSTRTIEFGSVTRTLPVEDLLPSP